MKHRRPSARKRSYTMTARRNSAAATRQRIVDAIMALHEEVGPRQTTIKGIAERAGVERLTVYRHFPDEASLFRACSSCWSELHPPPSPAAWESHATPHARTRVALEQLFGYFRENQRMLRQITRAAPDLPILAEVSAPFLEYLQAAADALASAWAPSGRREPVHAVLRHAVRFEAWALLEEDRWTDAQKIDRLLLWIEAAAQ